jgi:cell division protein FtsW
MFGFGKKKSKTLARNPKIKSRAKVPLWGSKKNQKLTRPSFQKKKEKGSIVNSIFDFSFNHNKRLAGTLLVILIVGIIAIFSSTIFFADMYQNGDKYYYLFSHLKFIGVGLVFMSFFYFVRIELISKLWYIPLTVCILLLAYLVFQSFLGAEDTSIDGATRWIKFGAFQFQPSDFAKLAFVIFISAFLGKMKHTYRDTKDFMRTNFLPFAGIYFILVALILLGRNLGTAMVVGFIGLACYGTTAVTKYQKSGFFLIIFFVLIGGVLFGIFESYRADRINVWVNYLKTNDTRLVKDGKLSSEGSSYQFDQVLTACGAGGAFGSGLGESIGKYYFVKTTAGDDSIFCIMGEELGFFMTSGIILLYIYLIFTCFSLAGRVADNQVYYLLLVAIGSWIGFQMFVHVGANLGVIPLTGQTLPFVSLGGSSIISLMGATGIILNISKQIEKHTTVQ